LVLVVRPDAQMLNAHRYHITKFMPSWLVDRFS